MVRNPVTDKLHSRKAVMDHYRYLIGKSIDDPANVRFRKLLRLIADLLEIPRDIHDELIKEAWRDRSLLGSLQINEYIRDDMDAMYYHLTGERYYIRPDSRKAPEPLRKERRSHEPGKIETHGLLDEYHGVFDDQVASTYSLLAEMEEDDISFGLSSLVMKPSVDSPFTSSGWIKSGKNHLFQ